MAAVGLAGALLWSSAGVGQQSQPAGRGRFAMFADRQTTAFAAEPTQVKPASTTLEGGRPDPNRFTRTVLVEGLNEPMVMDFDAAGRVYWIERTNGGIRRLDEKTGKVDLLGTIPNDNASESGLIGFLLARDFATSRQFFAYYGAPVTPREMRLSRFTLGANDQIDPSSEKVMLRTPWEPASHMGGGMVWDAQGNLYLSTGDDTGAGQYSSGLGGTGADSRGVRKLEPRATRRHDNRT